TPAGPWKARGTINFDHTAVRRAHTYPTPLTPFFLDPFPAEVRLFGARSLIGRRQTCKGTSGKAGGMADMQEKCDIDGRSLIATSTRSCRFRASNFCRSW